ncbi:hypothetical protein KAR91_48445 [Candidatus Pacearchaeota archaeon]|nr:hypothetical protein [Candidatus Pacearchaeota archaeon]
MRKRLRKKKLRQAVDTYSISRDNIRINDLSTNDTFLDIVWKEVEPDEIFRYVPVCQVLHK